MKRAWETDGSRCNRKIYSPFKREANSLEGLLAEPLIKPLPEVVDESSGFVIHGTNSSPMISLLEQLNKQPIAKIEDILRYWSLIPGRYALDARESLLEVLAADNETVLKKGVNPSKGSRAFAFYNGLSFSNGNFAFRRLLWRARVYGKM